MQPSEYLLDHENAEYVCPGCGESNLLYENVWFEDDYDDDRRSVDGWRDITVNADRELSVGREIHTDYGWKDYKEGIDYFALDVNTEGLGCGNCFWQGELSELTYYAPVRKGWDGQPIKAPHPEQIGMQYE